jgi:hypothetical protein
MRPARCSPSFACKEREEEGCGGRGRLPIGDEHRHGRHPLAKRRQREKARICTAPRWPVGRTWGPCPPFFFFFPSLLLVPLPLICLSREREQSRFRIHERVGGRWDGRAVQCSRRVRALRLQACSRSDVFPPGQFCFVFRLTARARVGFSVSRCDEETRSCRRAADRIFDNLARSAEFQRQRPLLFLESDNEDENDDSHACYATRWSYMTTHQIYN